MNKNNPAFAKGYGGHGKKNSICFVAGKTGGHILPCLTLAQQYHEDPHSTILFFSTNAPLDKAILHNHPMISHHIALPLGKFSSIPVYRHMQLAWRLAHAWLKSLYHLHKNKPKKIISTGGLVALPVCLAAYLLRIPIELYELNAVPGKAIKALAPLAHHTYVCFAHAARYFTKYPCSHTQYPVRFNAMHKQISKEQACKELGLDRNKKTVFIMGGSQGSMQLNAAIKKYIETSKRQDNLQIIHQTGSRDQTDWQTLYAIKNIPAVVFDYRDAVAPCYAAANLIIARAGAGTLFEILFFEKLSIIIPLEAKTTSHQLDNAYAMRKEYPTLFTVIRQDELTEKNKLFDYLDNFLTSKINDSEHP